MLANTRTQTAPLTQDVIRRPRRDDVGRLARRLSRFRRRGMRSPTEPEDLRNRTLTKSSVGHAATAPRLTQDDYFFSSTLLALTRFLPSFSVTLPVTFAPSFFPPPHSPSW